MNSEETLLVLDEVDYYQTTKQRFRFMQANELKVQIDNPLEKEQQMAKNEMTIVDTVVTRDSFNDIIPSGFSPY